MHAEVDPQPFVHESTVQRSLDVATRRWVLGLIAATTLGIASGAMALGAWPVMPFAGLEVVLVALGFRVLARHDGDYERLELRGDEVRLESREAHRFTRFVAHRPWARLEVRQHGWHCRLDLHYAGRAMPLGRLMSDEGRRQLAESLRGRLQVTASH